MQVILNTVPSVCFSQHLYPIPISQRKFDTARFPVRSTFQSNWNMPAVSMVRLCVFWLGSEPTTCEWLAGASMKSLILKTLLWGLLWFAPVRLLTSPHYRSALTSSTIRDHGGIMTLQQGDILDPWVGIQKQTRGGCVSLTSAFANISTLLYPSRSFVETVNIARRNSPLSETTLKTLRSC